MLSLGNAFRRRGRARVPCSASAASSASNGGRGLAFTAEPKIDGLSISLRYENGRLVAGATRGDGYRRRERHRQCPHHRRHPADAQGQGASPTPSRCAAKSIMSREAFLRLNEGRRRRGERIFANPRNAAAGLACASSIPRSPPAGRCNSSPMPGARRRSFRPTRNGASSRRSAAGAFRVNPLVKLCNSVEEMLGHLSRDRKRARRARLRHRRRRL